MFDYDLGPDIPTYIYECKICKREVKIKGIIKCDICKRRICKDCNIGGFCIEHFNDLSPEGQRVFKKIYQKHDMREKLIMPCFYIIYLLIIIPLSYVAIKNNLNSGVGSFISLILFIVIGIGVLEFVIFFTIDNSLEKAYLRKKLEIYSKYKQTNTEIQ